MERKTIYWGIGVLILAAITWFFRPLGIVHATAMFLYLYAPVMIPTIIIGIAATVYAMSKRSDYGEIRTTEDVLTIGSTAFVVALLVLSLTVGIYGRYAMMHDVYKEANYKEVTSLPPMDNQTIRAVPMIVAESLMNKYFTEARYYPDGTYITIINGSLAWAGQLTPDGTVIHYTLKPKGIIYVPMDHMDVSTVTANMKCGYNIGITDNIYWTLRKHKYWVDYKEPIPIIDNDTVYYIVPYTAYHLHLTHVTPYWGGVAVVNTKTCDVKYLTPTEAVKKYGSLPIFPEGLAKLYAESMNYQYNSAWANFKNIHFEHQNLIEIPDYNVGGNGQPFYVKLADGKAAWFIAAQPYGTGSGIKRIIMVTTDGKAYYRDFDKPITGVEAAESAIKNALPTFDWSQFHIVEPIPLQVGGQLYWRFVIVPNGASTIRMIALVPMTSEAVQPNDVKFFDTIGEFKAFLQGKGVEAPQTPAPTSTGSQISGTVAGLYVYTVNGTTHFIVQLDTENGGKLIDSAADCMNTTQIVQMFNLQKGENVTFTWNGHCYIPKK